MLQNPALKLVVGISAVSLAGILMYIYYKNKDDEEDEISAPPEDDKKLQKVKSSNQKEIMLRMVVTNDKIAIIAGRGGANLKMIEDKTGTIIQFKEKDQNNQWCEIRGKTDCVSKAKEMVLKDINRAAAVKEEIFVPQSACGKIIGRCGESLQEICRLSLAKVSVDSGDRTKGNSTRRIVITGYPEQVENAKKLIEDKVKEDENDRRDIEETELKREPRRSPTNSISSNHSSLTSLASYVPSKEKLNFSDTDSKPIEVYVSAIASPAKFWLQIVGPQSKKLDDLVELMTGYYNKKENQSEHKIADPYLGQIVAALFKSDGKWYRAEVVAIEPNPYNPKDVVLDLYFVDYGDSEYVQPHEVYELRSDFLTLRFQAIECYLAHVKPTLSNDPEMWDPETIGKFEEITHVASWKKLKSRIVTYKDRPRGGNHIRREGSPVPGVELFDTIEGTEVNLSHMLISHGFAMPDYPQQLQNALRLGGGDNNLSPNFSTSPISLSRESLQEPSNHVAGGSSPTPPFQNGSTNNLKSTKNSKNDTDNFIKTEITNGNNHLKSNLNDKKTNFLRS